METLDQHGDGLAIEVLEEECRDVDIDTARVREEAAEAELTVLGEQLEEAIVVRTEARKAFEAIGGDDAAARAAADCEEGLAAMQDAAERYVRVRGSAMLLRWRSTATEGKAGAVAKAGRRAVSSADTEFL